MTLQMKDLQDDQDGDDAEDDAAGDDITRAADTTTNGVSHAHDDDDDDHEAASPSGRPLSQQTPHGAAQPSSATAGENGQSQPSQSHGQSGQQLAGIVDLDYEAGPLSIEEQQVLAGCTQLADVAAATLKCFSKALLEGPGLSGGDRDLLDSWESCLFHSKHLQRSIEDIGAAMYPPQVNSITCTTKTLHGSKISSSKRQYICITLTASYNAVFFRYTIDNRGQLLCMQLHLLCYASVGSYSDDIG